MRIAMLSSSADGGGAAVAARRLCDGLAAAGETVRLLVRHSRRPAPLIRIAGADDPTARAEASIHANIQRKDIDGRRTEVSDTWFSWPYPGFDLSDDPEVANADVLNLHWVAGFQSPETVAALLRRGRPVVWTLHDEDAYTGGCHYTAGCDGFERDCRNCPQLREESRWIPEAVLERKASLWGDCRNLVLVSPSRWLAGRAGRSRLFCGRRIEVLPNAVDTAAFRPKPKAEARRALGIPAAARVLLFGAHRGGGRRKGLPLLLEALAAARSDPRFAAISSGGGLKVLTFGFMDSEPARSFVPIRHLGYIPEPGRLADLYAAADLFLLPSLEDNLPNTLLESLACGTPVVACAAGGIPEALEDGVTGALTPPRDARAFAGAILALLLDPERRARMGAAATARIEQGFRPAVQADRYRALFSSLIASAPPAPPPSPGEAVRDEAGAPSLPGRAPEMPEAFRRLFLRRAMERIAELEARQNAGLIRAVLERLQDRLRRLRERFRAGR
ncbi:MAG: glycosyltransferase [Planctomycetota bacterium]